MNRFSVRMALVSMIAPITLAVIGVALQLAWLPSLPSTIATHWSFDGRPDASGPAWTMPVLLAVTGIALPALFGGLLYRSRAAGPTATQKLLAVASLFAVTLLSIVVTASVAIQLPGVGAPNILLVLGVALAIGLALAVIGWFVLPKSVVGRSAAGDPVVPVAVAPGERVAWVGFAGFTTIALVALIATVVLVTGAVAFAVAATGAWPLVLVPIVLAFALLGTTSWTVRVDAGGLTVRGALGWPAFRVAVADIDTAGVTSVMPLGEFGGYGIRWGIGRRLGIITRDGQALEVKRRDGRAVIVTVDDADTAAGLLTALAARSGTDGKRG